MVCFTPIYKLIKWIRNKGFSFPSVGEKSGEKRRLKQYTPVNDENYDDLNEKVKEALSNENNEVEGI